MTIFFDLDGVLVDTEPLYHRFWKEAAEACGFALSSEEALGLRSLDNQLSRKWFGERFGEGAYDAVRNKRIELMETYRGENPIRAKKGAPEILTELKNRGICYYVVTASPLERVARYKEDAGLPVAMEQVITTKTIARGKPFPDVYLEACRISGSEAADCFAVEDSPNGIRSAHDAGCRAVMIPDLSAPTEEDRKYTAEICTDLYDFLNRVVLPELAKA